MKRKLSSNRLTQDPKPLVADLDNAEKVQEIHFVTSQNSPLFISLDNAKKSDEKTYNGWAHWLTPTRILVLSPILLALLIYSYFFIIPKMPKTNKLSDSLLITYTSQEYISRGDINTIDISLTNLDPYLPFNGSITLIIPDENIPIMASTEKKLSMEIKNLSPGDRITGQIKFSLPIRSNTQKVEYYFQTFNTDGIPYSKNGILSISNQDSFVVSPFPYLRTIMALIVGGLGLASADFIRSFIKKLIGLE